MAAPTDTRFANVLTPRKVKVYCRQNICLLCAMSFVVVIVSDTGEKVQTNLFKQKLRLTEEKVAKIREVLPSFDADKGSQNGVCIKCFSKTEKVVKMRSEASKLERELQESRSIVQQFCVTLPSPSPKKITSSLYEKRLISRSPLSSPAPKLQRQSDFPTTFMVKTVTKILPIILPKPAPETEIPKATQPVRESCQTNLPMQGETTSMDAKQKARRSLGFSSKKDEDSSAREGDVKLTVHYPSGTKNTYVYSETHKKICKAILQKVNVEKVIVDAITLSCPEVVINAAANIVKEECKTLCKRGSGTILQKKDHDDLFSFNFKSLYSELSERCPGLLSVLSSMVADVSPSIGSKDFHHILVSACIGLHGRSQEMSVLQYLVGFIMTHGGCTLRVCIFII